MKTRIIILLLAFCSGLIYASDKYTQVMQSNIEVLYQAANLESLQQSVNSFERIGNAEKDKWEPFYYASFGYIMMATRQEDGIKKDGYLDKAAEILKRAAAQKPNDSEIVALEGFIYMIRVTVDPATRGQQYSGLAMQTFGKAISLNPENPRALSLMAQMEYGTAQFFNASTDKACATGRQAAEKFESFRSDNPLAPQWGKESALRFLQQCQ